MKYAYTFDDIQIIPKYSEVDSRGKCNLVTNFTKQYKIGTPLVASPMDTVTEYNMAITIASYFLRRSAPVISTPTSTPGRKRVPSFSI